MTLLYTILAGLGVIYLVISCVFLFNRIEGFHLYKDFYKRLPEMDFYRSVVGTRIYSKQEQYFLYDINDNFFVLREDTGLFYDGFWRYFDLYSWFWFKKFQKWFDQNVDIDNLESI